MNLKVLAVLGTLLIVSACSSSVKLQDTTANKDSSSADLEAVSLAGISSMSQMLDVTATMERLAEVAEGDGKPELAKSFMKVSAKADALAEAMLVEAIDNAADDDAIVEKYLEDQFAPAHIVKSCDSGLHFGWYKRALADLKEEKALKATLVKENIRAKFEALAPEVRAKEMTAVEVKYTDAKQLVAERDAKIVAEEAKTPFFCRVCPIITGDTAIAIGKEDAGNVVIDDSKIVREREEQLELKGLEEINKVGIAENFACGNEKLVALCRAKLSGDAKVIKSLEVDKVNLEQEVSELKTLIEQYNKDAKSIGAVEIEKLQASLDAAKEQLQICEKDKCSNLEALQKNVEALMKSLDMAKKDGGVALALKVKDAAVARLTAIDAEKATLDKEIASAKDPCGSAVVEEIKDIAEEVAIEEKK